MLYNHANWDTLPWTEVRPGVRRKAFTGEGATIALNELLPHHEPRPHKHPHEQIAYITQGQCDYHIEDQVFRLVPGSMLVIPPTPCTTPRWWATRSSSTSTSLRPSARSM